MSQDQEDVCISTGQTLGEIIDEVAKENAAAMKRFSLVRSDLEYDLEKTRQWAVAVEKELDELKQREKKIDQALQQVVATQAKVIADQDKEIQDLTERTRVAEAALNAKQTENANLLEYINSLVN